MFFAGGDTGPWKQVIGVVRRTAMEPHAQARAGKRMDASTAARAMFLVLLTRPSAIERDGRSAARAGQIDSTFAALQRGSMDEVVVNRRRAAIRERAGGILRGVGGPAWRRSESTVCSPTR